MSDKETIIQTPTHATLCPHLVGSSRVARVERRAGGEGGTCSIVLMVSSSSERWGSDGVVMKEAPCGRGSSRSGA